jgi:hypothetical protein
LASLSPSVGQFLLNRVCRQDHLRSWDSSVSTHFIPFGDEYPSDLSNLSWNFSSIKIPVFDFLVNLLVLDLLTQVRFIDLNEVQTVTANPRDKDRGGFPVITKVACMY